LDILNYTENHKNFKQHVRSFAEKEIIPYVDQWEKDRLIPRKIWNRMGEEGLLCTTVESKYGGPGHDFIHAYIVADELVKTNHFGMGPSTHSDIVVPYIHAFAPEELKKKYLPGCASGDIITAIVISEPGAGSDLTSIEATAEEDGNEFILNGSKTFITNGIHCDLAVAVFRDPLVENPYEAMSIYLIEDGTPGFEKGNKLNKLGMYSQDTSELFFTNCRIPKINRIGEKGKGFYMLMQKLQQERLIVTIFAVGVAEYLLKLTMEYYKQNSGARKPVPKSQTNQFALVEMATDIKIGKTFLQKLISDHMEGKYVVDETSMAKFWTTEMVNRVADRCLDIIGQEAQLDTNPIVRYWRDMRIMTIFAGTNQIMRQIVAKNMKL
jgi:acyl-CoA dehydrogenase